MAITPLPTPPSRQDPVNFNDRADAFLSALPTFVTEANTTATTISNQEASAVAAASAAVAVSNVTKWVSGTTYAEGAAVWSPINGLVYRRITAAGAGAVDPSSDTTNYRQISGTGDVGTSGDQTISGIKTFNSPIVGNLNGNASTATNATTVTNGVYTTGDQTIGGTKTFTNGIRFSNGDTLSRDPMKAIMQYTSAAGYGAITTTTDSEVNISWYSGGQVPNNGRGALYNTRYQLFTDEFGTPVSATYLGANQFTINNLSDSTLRINVVGGVFSRCDDTYRYYVIRGGAIVNSTTHSGGTSIIDSTTSGFNVLRTTTTTQDIPPNSSVTFTHYSGVLSGASIDKLNVYFTISFNSWL